MDGVSRWIEGKRMRPIELWSGGAEWFVAACLVMTVLLFSSRVVCRGLWCRGLLRGEGLCEERDEWCLAMDGAGVSANDRTM